MRDRRLSLRTHKGDVQPNDSTVASVIESNLSFFFFDICMYAYVYICTSNGEREFAYSPLTNIPRTYLFSRWSDPYLVELNLLHER